MPSWKKVITSGSNAALNSLNVTNSLTASGLTYPATDGTSGQVVITDGNGNLSFSNIENTTITIKNMSGGTIAKGTPCYITGSGTSGNLAGVWPADASNPLRMPAGVIAGESLTAGAEGVGLINGYISGVNTSAFAAGDSVYVAVGGGYTNIRPTGSSVLIQKLGNVEKSHPSNGSGVINGPGYYNEVPNIQQGYAWVGNGNGVATPIATSSIQNVVSSSYALTSSHTTAIAGTTNYVSKFTGTGTLGTGSISDTGTQVKVGNFTLGTAGTTPNVIITGSTRFSGERNSYITVYTNAGNYGSVEGYGNGLTLSTVSSYSTSGGNIRLTPQSNSSIENTVLGTGNISFTAGGSTRMFISSSGNIGINTAALTSASLTIGGNVWAPSFTGSLFGTASRAVSASMAVLAPSYLPLAGGTMTGDIYAAGRTFQLQDLVLGVGTTFGTIKTDGGKYIGVYPTNGVESTRFLANGHVLFQNGGTYTDKGYRLQISASNSVSGALQVTGNSVMTGSLNVTSGITGSLFGTASWAQNAITASYTNVGSLGGFIQGGNSFGATALLGTNDNQSLALETNGTTKMFISSSGAVGIGTTSPVQSLHVVGSINIPTNSKLFWNNGNASIHETGNSLLFSTWTGAALTEKMSILGNGNVGIGTTSPSTLLHVSGTVANPFIVERSTANSNVNIQYKNTTTSWYAGLTDAGRFAIGQNIDLGSSTIFTITSASRVGIGVNNPGGNLDVYDSTQGSLYVRTGTAGANWLTSTTSAQIGTYTNHPFYLKANDSTAVTILGSGNVGIGITSPGSPLDVQCNGSALGVNIRQRSGNDFANLVFSDTSNTALGSIGYVGTSRLRLTTNGTGDANEKLSILANGNVGIGTTTPTKKLQLNISASDDGFLIAKSGSANNIFRVTMDGTNDRGEMFLNNGGTAIFAVRQASNPSYINTGNNFGIGTTTPNAKLDVNGNTIITGSLIVSQSLLQYSSITAVTSGSTSNVASFNTSSYTAAFFDYVTTSGTSARAGSVFTVWNGSSVEYTETSTNDIGSTSNLLLSASVDSGAVRLQATSLSGSWSVKTLARML